MRIGSLFSGYGGLEQGVQSVLGGTVAWHSEIDPGACKILAHRYPDVPNLGDITAVDWTAVEPVDVLTGGFPCQDLSAAGRRKGMRPGTRSGLWADFKKAIGELRPSLVVVENVRGLLYGCAETDAGICPGCAAGDDVELDEGRLGDGRHRPLLRALGRVLGDLANLGFDAEWIGLRASDIGAPHNRFRVFVIAWPAADASSNGRNQGRPESARLVGRPDAAGGGPVVPHPDGSARRERRLAAPGQAESGRAWADAGRRDRAPAADPYLHGRKVIGRELHLERDADGCRSTHTAWGVYESAVRRWEQLTRPAPPPREPTKAGERLSPRFVEWMQGLPEGWVTDPVIWAGMKPNKARDAQFQALGNGVVSQQAAHALRLLLPDVATPPTSVEIGGAA